MACGNRETAPCSVWRTAFGSVIIQTVSDLTARIDELAGLMDEFHLAEGERTGEGWRVAFKRRTAPAAAPAAVLAGEAAAAELEGHGHADEPVPTAEAVPVVTPVNSPMTGIYYTAQSPTAAPFVKEGDVVEAGQVVGLIEAMKVFNEIVSPMSGTVAQIVAQSGQLVQPGEALLFIR